MKLKIEATLGYWLPAEHDVLMALRVLNDPAVTLVEEALEVAGGSAPRAVDDVSGRRDWTVAQGSLDIRYTATVEVGRVAPDLPILAEDARHDLPAAVLPFLNPSRYCESDRLEGFVDRRFPGGGGARVAAMADWIAERFTYGPSGSTSLTTAADTLLTRQGICRDYAHALIALTRAAGVPARMVSAYALDLDPPDFHAVVEVWLAGGWRLVDPTRLAPIEGLVPIARGLDAAEVSFLAIWGTAEFRHQAVRVERV